MALKCARKEIVLKEWKTEEIVAIESQNYFLLMLHDDGSSKVGLDDASHPRRLVEECLCPIE